MKSTRMECISYNVSKIPVFRHRWLSILCFFHWFHVLLFPTLHFCATDSFLAVSVSCMLPNCHRWSSQRRSLFSCFHVIYIHWQFVLMYVLTFLYLLQMWMLYGICHNWQSLIARDLLQRQRKDLGKSPEVVLSLKLDRYLTRTTKILHQWMVSCSLLTRQWRNWLDCLYVHSSYFLCYSS